MEITNENQRKFKHIILRFKIAFLFYGKMNCGYKKGALQGALLLWHSNILTPINFPYVNITMK